MIPLEQTEAATATDKTIHKSTFRSVTTTLIISNEETRDIIKIVKSFEEPGLLIKHVSETIKIKQNNTKEDFLVCCQVY